MRPTAKFHTDFYDINGEPRFLVVLYIVHLQYFGTIHAVVA